MNHLASDLAYIALPLPYHSLLLYHYYICFFLCVYGSNYARLITFLISISSPYNRHRPTNNKMHPTGAFYYALLIGCKNIAKLEISAYSTFSDSEFSVSISSLDSASASSSADNVSSSSSLVSGTSGTTHR